MSIVALAVLLVSCETKEHADAEIAGLKRAREVARQASAHADTSAADLGLGIPECDDYVKKVSVCLDEKVPADDQPAIRFQLESQKKKWTQMSQDPASRDALPEECKAASALAVQSMARYGCDL